MTPVRLEPAALQSRVKHSTTEPLRCLFCCFTCQVNSYGHGGMVSSSNHTFSRTSLNMLTYTFACNWQQPFSNDSAEERRMTVEIIHDQSPRKYVTGPGSNSRSLDLQSDSRVARHVTGCALGPVLERWFDSMTNDDSHKSSTKSEYDQEISQSQTVDQSTAP